MFLEARNINSIDGNRASHVWGSPMAESYFCIYHSIDFRTANNVKNKIAFALCAMSNTLIKHFLSSTEVAKSSNKVIKGVCDP